MKKEFINPEGVWHPSPPFSFSQAIKVSGGSLVFLSGQVSVDAAGKTVGQGDAGRQARQILENIRVILEAAGGSLRDVVKLVVYLPDLGRAKEVWEVRKEYFPEPAPCSTGLEVKGLASPDWLLEVDVWAVVSE